MLHFIISHLSDIFMILCGIFLGAFIIVLEVYIGTRIEKGLFPHLLYTLCVLAFDSFLLAFVTLK
jgi:hypothetical protein|nr:MAG TPA: hypothetical protein [Caudoviricetes sp.]